MSPLSRQENQSGCNSPRGSKRGATLAAAVICLLVIMLFSSAVVSALTTRFRATRLDEQQLQCLFLADSAAARAQVKCAANSAYTGETWSIELDSQGVARTGVAEIRVEPIANQPGQRRVHVEARWPDDPVHRVQRIKELTIRLPENGAAS